MTELKFERLRQKKTQSQLEQESGVKRWKISLAECGLLRLSSHEVLALARVLGTKTDLLSEARGRRS